MIRFTHDFADRRLHGKPTGSIPNVIVFEVRLLFRERAMTVAGTVITIRKFGVKRIAIVVVSWRKVAERRKTGGRTLGPGLRFNAHQISFGALVRWISARRRQTIDLTLSSGRAISF